MSMCNSWLLELVDGYVSKKFSKVFILQNKLYEGSKSDFKDSSTEIRAVLRKLSGN